MRFTLDGTTPTETHGNLTGYYLANVSVTPTNAGTVLKTIAFQSGWITSAVKSATYYTSATPTPTPTATPTGTPFCRSCFPTASLRLCRSRWSGRALVCRHRQFRAGQRDGRRDGRKHGLERPGSDRYLSLRGRPDHRARDYGNLYFQDSLGNTSHVTDAAGNLKESYTYSPFGTPYFYYPNDPTGNPHNASAIGIRHSFQGQLWTQETGLNDYRNRVELPVMGVFLQPDPIGFKGDAANIYRFCNNDAEGKKGVGL